MLETDMNHDNLNSERMDRPTERPTWWGEYSLNVGDTGQWEIGPLRLLARRLADEWLVAHEEISEPEAKDKWRFSLTDRDPADGSLTDLTRFVGDGTIEQLSVMPALADRAYVIRPSTPFQVAPDETTTFYVDTPLWVRLTSENPPQLEQEIATRRPSDTWFGPSTMEGELCYASKTFGRLNFNNLLVRPYRAITQIHIENQAGGPLHVHRFKLPVPYLSLFATAGGELWTETVSIIQTQDTELSRFSIGQDPPEAVLGAELVTPPRQYGEKSLLVRAFGALKRT